MKIAADFVISAAAARDVPRDHLEQVALVGRSNVGKSRLINALVGANVARTSAAPGKTRLANIYRVARGAGASFYLVDLPGYGYARGGAEAARGFDELTRAYFTRGRESTLEAEGQRSPGQAWGWGPTQVENDGPQISALLLVDSRHPGLPRDIEAWRWLRATVAAAAIVATKVDKLARGERIRAMRKLESVFQDSVTPVSASTGEGLDELWKLIDRLANSRKPQHRRSSNPPRATAPTHPRKK